LPGRPDGRRRQCAQEWADLQRLLPLLAHMHEMSPDHVHEDLELQALDLTTYNIEWTARLPRWRDWYLSHDREPHYRFLRTALQALQWLDRRAGRPPSRWLLKCPQHLENLRVLHSVFPDAVLVLTHRDPVDALQSAATMIAYGDRLRRTRVNPPGTAAYWLDRLEGMLQACVAQRDAWPAHRSLDLRFHDVVRDETAAMQAVYRVAAVDMTPSLRARLAQHLRKRPAEGRPTMRYDLLGDFGLDPCAARARFTPYIARFLAASEAGPQ